MGKILCFLGWHAPTVVAEPDGDVLFGVVRCGRCHDLLSKQVLISRVTWVEKGPPAVGTFEVYEYPHASVER